MKILKIPYILTPDTILRDVDVAFDGTIIEVGKDLEKKYPEAAVESHSHAALLPGFANPHLHLEFSANRATLSYGDFLVWLQSVIRHRDALIPACDEACLERTIDTIIAHGTTTIGAVSSYGGDLEACVRSPLNIAYFSEIIGSNPAAADVLYADFIERYYRAKKYESERFRSYVAIHSPYSVHRILAKKALEIAKKHDDLVSVHFMESPAEREWLDSDSGPFAAFFKEFLGQASAANRPMEFLELFEDIRTLYVHAVWASDEELDFIAAHGGSIVHCPVSNRLLGNGVLNLKRVESRKIPWLLATDGLSSNFSLSLYDEMRAALFVHPERDAVAFARELVTTACAQAERLGFHSGRIEAGYRADMQLVQIPQDLQVDEEIYLHLILHTQKPLQVYIGGQ
jgi:cytosine/adenosine deaminase-related metal-dependent hydrolase